MRKPASTEPAPVAPLLTDYERRAGVWPKLAKHLEARLESLRKQNDGPLDPEETARLRGRIAEVKAMLDKGKDPIEPE